MAGQMEGRRWQCEAFPRASKSYTAPITNQHFSRLTDKRTMNINKLEGAGVAMELLMGVLRTCELSSQKSER